MADRKEITVRAVQREGRGKNDASRLRRDGMVPLTVYGDGGEAVSAAAPLAELAAILRTEAGANTIFTLDVDGVGASEVLFLDRQIDPVRGRLLHADLRRLVRGQKVEITVPLHFTGEPESVKDGEGIFEQIVREISIRCAPRDIPEGGISIDVAHLNLHDVLHASDIKVDEKIEILEEPDAVIATVGMAREEEVEAASTDETPAEPEVIGKGKKDGEEA